MWLEKQAKRNSNKIIEEKQYMKPTLFNPLRSLRQLENDPFSLFSRPFDDYFDKLWGGTNLPTTWETTERAWSQFSPTVELKEKNNMLTVTAEVPGVDEKDLDITLDEKMLSIKGEKKFEKTHDEKDYHYSERRFGSFHRQIPLPYEVNREKVRATFKNGVLNIELEKNDRTKEMTRKIPISQTH